MQMINMGARFVLELCLLAALGYWGFQLDRGLEIRMLAGVGAPLLAAVIWGTSVAPKAPRLLADPWRFGVEIVLFGVGAGVLLWAERPLLAAALIILFLVNRVTLMAGGVIA